MPNPTPAELIESAERLSAKATDGPWYALDLNLGEAVRDKNHRCVAKLRYWEADEARNEDNVPFIVWCRTGVPLLAAALREALAENELRGRLLYHYALHQSTCSRQDGPCVCGFDENVAPICQAIDAAEDAKQRARRAGSK